MAFLPPINAPAYPYDTVDAQNGVARSRGNGRKRQLQIAVVDGVDYDVYYEQEVSGVNYRSTRAMDEHVLARMRDDIRRAAVRQANPESAMPEREVEEEDKLHEALQEYNARMAQSYGEALKLPMVLPADNRSADDASEFRTPQKRWNQSPRTSPAPKEPAPSSRSVQSTSTAPRPSVSQRGWSQSDAHTGVSGSRTQARSGPRGTPHQRSKSGRGETTSRSSRAGSRHPSSHRHGDRSELPVQKRDEPQDYSSGELDDFIRKEQQRSMRYAEKQDLQSGSESEMERREKLRRAQELAQRLQDDTATSDREDWD